MLRTIVLNSIRPSNRIVLKYICEISKALVSIHNSKIVHAAIRPSNIYLNAENCAMLGEFKKVELDSARQTNQLFSKVLVGQAIPKILIYWAPEVLKLEKYGYPADMWSLGVTIYQIVTGEHPF
jgi:NIMA (never in mitosis gene a)-related kinase